MNYLTYTHTGTGVVFTLPYDAALVNDPNVYDYGPIAIESLPDGSIRYKGAWSDWIVMMPPFTVGASRDSSGLFAGLLLLGALVWFARKGITR